MGNDNIEKARLKYKPDHIKLLLIAEAPPDKDERFFYYENVKEMDYLFLGVVEAIDVTVKDKYLQSRRDPKVKELILNWLKDLGIYLIDLSDIPVNGDRNNLSKNVQQLVGKVSDLINENTIIALIKANVYDIAFDHLNKRFKNVVNIKIPFPSSGQQNNFQREFKKVLELTGLC